MIPSPSGVVATESIGSFDYIILGAGSAGCVLANRLSEDPRISVLLVEAGGRDDWHWLHIPAGTFYSHGNPRADWCYVGEPEPALDGRRMNHTRGRTLGGSSAINGMVYIRGQARDYDIWRQMGNVGWGWDDVLPYFRKSERHHGGATAFHGADGPLDVEVVRTRWAVLDALCDAAAEAGIPPTDDFNRGDNSGTGYFEVTQRRGRRASAATAFLRPIRHRTNLKVLTSAQAVRLRMEHGRVVGVDLVHDGAIHQAQARTETILSLGAIGSPQLLQLSGIGPADLLASVGIPIQHDLPGVGENLQDHLSLRFVQKVHGVPTLNERFHSLPHRALMGIEYAVCRTGPLVMGAPIFGGFARTDETRDRPNVQFLVAPFSLEAPGKPPHRFSAVSGGIYNLTPQSRGHVRIVSTDPNEQPAILNNYLTDPDDRRVAADSYRLIRRIFAAPAFTRYRSEELRPPPEAQSDEALLEFAKASCGTAFHPSCTCRMGRDRMAVVDERLRVYGVAGLRVVDASIMPILTSGNTNATTIMIAEKAADMIRADARVGVR